ncbi:MAG TPA: HAMP domain-containing sensor histidine kinase, partial [Allosphingosinicella sp.]|nr:HAMP domain-containing sensor histidine kinase [Allosphingosinicella sp.]
MHESERTLAATIDTDIAGLADIHLTGGAEELRRRIEDRIALSQQQGERSFYMLASPNGRKHTGNIERWPDLAAETSQIGEVTIAGGHRILARATQLRSDLQLVVGRSLEPRDALLQRMLIGFLAAGSLAALLSLTVGHQAARRLRKRVGTVNEALVLVEEGELGRRAPGADRPDELGALARDVNRTLDRVEQLIAAHRNVSDHTAHEIRTPLMHLDAQLRTALDRTIDPQMAEWLGGARTEIRSIVQLLDSLLDIASAEAMRGDLRGLGEIDLSEIAQSVADLYEGSAEELGLVFRCRISPAVQMRGDAMQMTRLLTNLLDNAFKYVPAGGRVGLLLDVGPRIIVEDNGPGI